MQNFKSIMLSSVILSMILLVSCKEKSNVGGTAATGSMESKVVFINLDTLLEKYTLYQESKTTLEDESRKADQALAGKLETFQKRAYDFQQRVYQTQQRAAELAPVQLQALEQKFAAEQQKLAKEEADLGQKRDNAARELQDKLVDLQTILKNKIDEHLEKIAAERAYDYVLIKGNGGGVLFGKASLDITEQTVKELNELHESSGEKSSDITKEVAKDTTSSK